MTSTRLERRMTELRGAGRKALVAYIMTGDPTLEQTVPAMRALVRGGADLVELGIPFSDPEADGPIIQAAAERSLANGVRFEDVLAQVRTFREFDDATPIILMGYLNTVERMGSEVFAARIIDAGVDGLIMVNLPPEESAALTEHLRGCADIVFLATPTSTDERLASIAELANGFLYYVSLKGTTGAGHIEVDSVRDNVARIRGVTDLPVLAGFGIKDADTARSIGRYTDGVVVGSAIVNAMAELEGQPERIPERLQTMLGDLRRALDES